MMLRVLAFVSALTFCASAASASNFSADFHSHKDAKGSAYASYYNGQLTWGWSGRPSQKAWDLQYKREQLRQMPWDHYEELINEIIGWGRSFQSSMLNNQRRHTVRTGKSGPSDVNSSSNNGSRDDWGNNS